jgi:hypothetical protein
MLDDSQRRLLRSAGNYGLLGLVTLSTIIFTCLRDRWCLAEATRGMGTPFLTTCDCSSWPLWTIEYDSQRFEYYFPPNEWPNFRRLHAAFPYPGERIAIPMRKPPIEWLEITSKLDDHGTVYAVGVYQPAVFYKQTKTGIIVSADWAGVCGDVSLVSCVAVCLLIMIRFLRSYVRIRRGTCPNCAYPLQQSSAITPCPECGRTLSDQTQFPLTQSLVHHLLGTPKGLRCSPKADPRATRVP